MTARRPHRPSEYWAKGEVAYRLTTASICPVCIDNASRPDCEAVMAAVYLGAALRGLCRDA